MLFFQQEKKKLFYGSIVKTFLIGVFAVLLFACMAKKGSSPDPSSSPKAPAYEQLLEQGEKLMNDRRHIKAMDLFNKAGLLEPKSPEWLYLTARTLFYMDQFEESAKKCQQAIDRSPDFYEALEFLWAARLEAANLSDEAKEAVRQEIKVLLFQSGSETKATMAAYRGYYWLKDREAQQRLIVELAGQAEFAEPEMQELIARELFEQIIQARENVSQQIILSEAYITNFSQNRMAKYVTNSFLKKKQDLSEDKMDPQSLIYSLLQKEQPSKQVNIGMALWMIESDRNNDGAIRLLEKSLELMQSQPDEKPTNFTDDLWQEEQDKQKDMIHYLIGRAWFNIGNLNKAEAQLTMVEKKKRNWDQVYHFLGMTAKAGGEYQKAIAYFSRALEINERDDETASLLKELLLELHGYQGDPARYKSDQQIRIMYTDATEKAGLGDLPAVRVSWGDYNQDGFDDLLVDGHRLFQNLKDGSFKDITKESGLDAVSKAHGGIWGDYNNDGYLDIFVFHRSQNYLFKNNGTGVFEDVTVSALGPVSRKDTQAAAWGDLDNDGFLDLYVANYERSAIMRGIARQDQLYHNNGNGSFTDISISAGIITEEAMCGRGVIWTDINQDGFQDIVVANYRLDPNFLWLNKHQSNFVEKSDVFGLRGYMVDGAFGHSIGPVSGDLNNDSHRDLFISNLAHPRFIEFSDKNMMLISQGPPDYYLTDQFEHSGIAFEETNSDPSLADVDNDGDLDLYMTSIYKGRNSHLYINDGKGSFTDVTWRTGTRVQNTWGAAFSDYNNDGFADLAVASPDGLKLFSNNGNQNHWIKVKIIDERCNKYGIGSFVTIRYSDNQQTREISAGRGAGNQDARDLIFGLADYNGPVEIEMNTLCGGNLKKRVDHPDQTVVLKYLP